MPERSTNRVREQREARHLTQVVLAERAGLSRQSVSAIEAGRATPAVDVALRLARALDCQVEDLFGDPPARAALMTDVEGPVSPGRAALARVGGRWVSYPLLGESAALAADGIVTESTRAHATVEPLRAHSELLDNVVLMGCATGLGLLTDRLNARSGAGRFLWLPRSSTAALRALGAQRTHLAGVHLVDGRTGEANVSDVRRVVGSEPIALVTLARWDAGLVVRASDRSPVRAPADLGRPGLRVVGRERGAGAQRLLLRTLRAHGIPLSVGQRPALVAAGHMDVARAVAMGAADVGVATRDAALALGLGFVPLAVERYDLAVPRSALEDPRLGRLFDMLSSGTFRRDLAALGYDVTDAGDFVTSVEAA